MFTIGEFSKINKITPRMLRHYDKLSLLNPAKIGDNGYRYYTVEQIDILKKIIILKDIGIPLKTIVKIRKNNFCNIKDYILEHESILIQKMENLSSIVASLHDINFTKEYVSNNKNKFHIEVVRAPAQYIISKKFILSHPIPTKILPLIEELKNDVSLKKITPSGYPILLWDNKDFNPESSKLEIAIPIIEKEFSTGMLEEQLFACSFYNEEYDKILYFYTYMFNWINQNNFKSLLPIREIRYNYNDYDNLENQLTLIMIPIEPII